MFHCLTAAEAQRRDAAGLGVPSLQGVAAGLAECWTFQSPPCSGAAFLSFSASKGLFCPSVQLLPSSSGRVPSAARKQHQDVPQELCQ